MSKIVNISLHHLSYSYLKIILKECGWNSLIQYELESTNPLWELVVENGRLYSEKSLDCKYDYRKYHISATFLNSETRNYLNFKKLILEHN